MRINEITNWAYGLTLVFTGLSAAAFIAASHAAYQERVAVEDHTALDRLVDDLALGAGTQSGDARFFIMAGGKQHLADFYRDEMHERHLAQTINALKIRPLSPSETDILHDIEDTLQKLDTLERSAVAAAQSGGSDQAKALLMGPDHGALYHTLMGGVTAFRKETSLRTLEIFQQAQQRSDLFSLVARVMLGLTAVLFLGVLYFVLRRRVATPLTKMVGVMRRLAQQDYQAVVPDGARQDEIGDMHSALELFRRNGLERDRLDEERQKEQRTKDRILQMMHRLQACQERSEIADILSRFMPRIFPGFAGALLSLSERKSYLMTEIQWGNPKRCEEVFDISDCWGLRRGHMHESSALSGDTQCRHLRPGPERSLCVPLLALGETIGVLYVEVPPEEPEEALGPLADIYLALIAENISLAIANLDLRRTLTRMAERDPLTGLYNRRTLDTTFASFADHPTAQVSCIMLDIDLFKRFNDQFGHDAGDMVIRHVAQIMQNTVADTGSVYRYGGEEFTIFLPEIGMKGACRLAEAIRETVSQSPLSFRGALLGAVTVSMGVSEAPSGGPMASLISRADAALLQAKEQGRNRVSVDPAPLGR